MLSLRLQNPTPLPAGGRLRALDELKGWAMLLVILYHTGGVLGWSNWFHGEVGVDVFLVVSGFSLARSSRNLGTGEFLRRRLGRIFPAYWLALALFLLLSLKLFGVHRSSTNIILHALGLHGFAFTQGIYFSDINDSFWYISLILLLYLAFPSVRRQLANPARVTGIGLLLSVAAAWAYIQADHAGGLSHLAGRIPCFFLGLVAGQVSIAPETELKADPVFMAGLIATAVMGWMTGFFPFSLLAGPAAIVIFFILRRTLQKHPDGRWALAGLALLGVYSYEVFLFHQPLIRDYNTLFWSRCFSINQPSQGQLAIGVIGGLMVTFALSFVVHQTVNRLFSGRKKNLPPSVA